MLALLQSNQEPIPVLRLHSMVDIQNILMIGKPGDNQSEQTLVLALQNGSQQ